MPKPTSKTPQRIERMIAMHAEGASAREIAEELGIRHSTALVWMHDAHLEPNGGQGSRATRKREKPGGVSAKLLEKQRRLAELEIPAPSTDLPGLLADLHVQEAEARAFVRYCREAVKAGTGTIGDLDKAQIIVERLATKIAQLTPPTPPDPEQDPNNIQAAAETRKRFASLVEAAERQRMNGGHR